VNLLGKKNIQNTKETLSDAANKAGLETNGDEFMSRHQNADQNLNIKAPNKSRSRDSKVSTVTDLGGKTT
jgi:hypothetical protein